MTSRDHIDYQVRDGIATLTLDRPERKNAFTMEMVDRWAATIVEAGRDPAVRVLVVTGRGDAFCAGADLTILQGEQVSPLQRKAMLTEHVHRVAYALEAVDVPVLAALNGSAVGAGLDMALMCDLRLADEEARLSTGYLRVGLVPGDGGAYFLPRLVGVSRALDLLWTGEFLSAGEALGIGLVDRVFTHETFTREVGAFAERLAAQSPIAVRMIKRAVYQSARCDLRTALDLISSHMGIVQSTSDAKEAINAFREQRPARFTGL
ncbi:MAG: enoyl-CoA hydratase/isomerase family protein [Mycobacteriales bacterium]